MEWQHPSIIAMKGYPYTGKTSIAFDIAVHLRLCLRLNLDEILDSISPLPPVESDKVISLAFNILCGLVENHLSLGLSVIIDSLPLSRAHLDRLVALSKSSTPAAKLVIVDCQIPIDRHYAWQRRFEEDRTTLSTTKWYKARDWYEDVLKLIKGDDTRLDDPIEGVSRLFLNVDKLLRGRHIIQAIQTLILCPDDRHVDFHTWSEYNLAVIHQYEYHQDHSNCTGCRHDDHNDDHRVEKELIHFRRVTERARFCQDGHSITIYKPQGLSDYEADCGVCEKPVLGAAYACEFCELALHKSCAEMESVEKRFRSFAPDDFPTFIREIDNADPREDPHVYSFPENHACLLCREAGEGFSDKCSSCIFETHLKCGLFPTIIDHDGDRHKLFFGVMRISAKGEYKCAACGKAGAYASYTCIGCQKSYHAECALLPYPIQDHLHGGRKHPLELMYYRDDGELENYPCDHCLDMMNPEDWYYHCGLCRQIYHLKCAFLKDDD